MANFRNIGDIKTPRLEYIGNNYQIEIGYEPNLSLFYRHSPYVVFVLLNQYTERPIPKWIGNKYYWDNSKSKTLRKLNSVAKYLTDNLNLE